jgi:hypothetical protein
MIRFYLLLSLICFANLVNAQDTTKRFAVRGNVIDQETKLNIGSGTVYLLRTDSTVINSRSIMNGKFNFDSVENGNYMLIIKEFQFEDFIKKISIENSDLYLENIELKKSSNTLDQITVKAYKQDIAIEAGQIVVQVKNEPYFEGLKAMEIISKLSGVFVSNGVIYLNGVKVNLIRINNIDYTLETAIILLESMTNNDIEKIKVIKEGFSKEDASNSGGIIELITYHSKKMNQYISILSDVGYGKKARNNQGINYTYNKKQLNFSIALYRNDNTYFRKSEYKRYYNLSGLDLQQEVQTNINTVNYPVRIYFDNTFKKKHTVSLNYFGFPQTAHSKQDDVNNGIKNLDNFKLEANNYSVQKTLNQEFVTQYDYTSDSSTFKLKARSAYYSYYGNTTGYLDEKCTFQNEIQNWNKYYNTYVQSKNSNYVAAIDFTNTFRQHKITLSYGSKFSFIRTKNQQNFIYNNFLDSLKSNNNLYTENILAGYIETKIKFSSKMDFVSGLRYENVSILGQSQLFNSEFVNRKYDNWFPSLGLSFEKSKNMSLTIYASRKIERPNLNQLNPSIIYYDSLSYRKGNPTLLPSYSLNTGIDMLIRKMIVVSLYFKKITDFQSNFASPISNYSDTYVLSTFNYPKAQMAGINISSPVPNFKGIKTFVNTGWSYRKYWVNDNLKTEGGNYYLGISPTYTNSKKRLVINSYLYILSPNVTGVFDSKLMYRFDMGIYYSFLKEKNLKIGVQGYDIFNSFVTSVGANLPQISLSGKEFNDIRSVYLKINYTIGTKSKEEILSEKEEKERLMN